MLDLTPDNVRGLSLWQPHAQLVALGVKRVETRSWCTAWNQFVMIHASLRSSGPGKKALAHSPAWAELRAAGDLRTFGELEQGAVLAVAVLADCYLLGPGFRIPERERLLGDFTPGRYAWVFSDVVRLARPVFVRGMQRLWFPSRELVQRVRAELPSAGVPVHKPADDLHARIAP